MNKEDKKLIEALLGRGCLVLHLTSKGNEQYHSGILKRIAIDTDLYCVETRSEERFKFKLSEVKEITLKVGKGMCHIVISLI